MENQALIEQICRYLFDFFTHISHEEERSFENIATVLWRENDRGSRVRNIQADALKYLRHRFRSQYLTTWQAKKIIDSWRPLAFATISSLVEVPTLDRTEAPAKILKTFALIDMCNVFFIFFHEISHESHIGFVKLFEKWMLDAANIQRLALKYLRLFVHPLTLTLGQDTLRKSWNGLAGTTLLELATYNSLPREVAPQIIIATYYRQLQESREISSMRTGPRR